MNSLKYFCLPIVFILFFFSCDVNDPIKTMPEVDSNHFPLKVGNYWEYYYLALDTIGIYYKQNIISDTSINGETWFKVFDSYSDNYSGEFLYQNKTDGLWKKDDPFKEEYLYLKYPCQQGDIYETAYEYVKVESISDTIILFTTGERMATIKYIFTEKSLFGRTWFEYFVPGLGIVRFDDSYSSISTKDLANYYLR